MVKDPMQDNSFFSYISKDAVLHIPAGTRDAYIAAGWDQYFASMEEFDPTSITAPRFDSTISSWHTLSGHRLSSPPTRKGVYIRDKKKS